MAKSRPFRAAAITQGSGLRHGGSNVCKFYFSTIFYTLGLGLHVWLQN